MATFGWTEQFIRTQLPGAKGWVYYYWALEHEMGLFGSNRERLGNGYVKQEVERLKRERRKN